MVTAATSSTKAKRSRLLIPAARTPALTAAAAAAALPSTPAFAESADWCGRPWEDKAQELLRHLQSRQLGFFDTARTKPIVQCPVCFCCNTPETASPAHDSGCALLQVVDEYD